MKLKKCNVQPTINDLVTNAKTAIERYAELPSNEMGNGKAQVIQFISQIYLAKMQIEASAIGKSR